MNPPSIPWLMTLVAILGLTAVTVEARDKTDIVTLTNGDHITCEVRQLELGILTVKTDTMGTIKIEWPSVARIKSHQLFEVEDDAGDKHFGIITQADEDGRFKVLLAPSGTVAVKHDRIIRITALEETWFDRWRGHVDLGFTFISANSSTQLSLDSEATYRTKKYLAKGSLTSVASDREDVDKTSWSTFAASYERFLTSRWFWTGFGSWEQNEELQLDARSTVGGGMGRYLLQSNRNVVSLMAGVNGNRENYTDIEGEWTSEAVLELRHDFFLFGDHETSWSSTLTTLPSLSSWGRIRVDFTTSLRRELVSDFTVSLTLTESYDSDPPQSGETEKNDTRVVTSLGWSF